MRKAVQKLRRRLKPSPDRTLDELADRNELTGARVRRLEKKQAAFFREHLKGAKYKRGPLREVSSKRLKLTPAKSSDDYDAIMLITVELYNALYIEIDEWLAAINLRHGKTVKVVVAPHCEFSPEVIREYLRQQYISNSIEGVIFVGQWNLAHWVCTMPNGNIKAGPLVTFYTELDQGMWYRDESDPSIKGLVSTYNRVDRNAIEFPHDNISFSTGKPYEYGPEVWCVLWRAVGISKPKNAGDDAKEIEQLSRFIQKSTAWQRRNFPCFIRGQLTIHKNVGMSHPDYEDNTNDTLADTTGYVLEHMIPREWYHNEPPMSELAFLEKYRKTVWRRQLFFDVFTHAGPVAFWPKDQYTINAKSIFEQTKQGCGFLATFIFGCSSGLFELCEAHPTPHLRYNYALSLLMSQGIDLSTVGTPWGFGYGWPYKIMTYSAMIHDQLPVGEAFRMADSEAMYRSSHPPEIAEMKVNPYMFFGDPYVSLPKVS